MYNYNEALGASKQRLLLKSLKKPFKDKSDRVEILNQFFSHDNAHDFLTLNKIKKSFISDLNELKLYSPKQPEAPTNNHMEVLKNLTPRNFLLEQKIAAKKQLKSSVSAYTPYITDNISKLMKKYSIY